MFGFLFSKKKNEIPAQLYRQISDRARNPVFFDDFGFDDTVMGRFDCLSLHVFLASNRMANGAHEYLADLNQEVYDCFVGELDMALRELGVGDPTVPKRKKKLVRSFYGTIEDFSKALKDGDSVALAEKANLRYYGNDNEEVAKKLGNYLLVACNHLEKITDEELLNGKIDWPTP